MSYHSTMRPLFFLVLFHCHSSLADIPMDVINQLGGLKEVGVDAQEAFKIVKEESAKLGISFALHYDNCLGMGHQEDYGAEMESFFTKEFQKHSPFTSTEKLLEVIERRAPKLWAGKARFDKMITKLDKQSQQFAKDLYKRILTVAVFVSQHYGSPMEYFPLLSRAIKKTTSSYEALPQSSKDSLERVTCWYTLFRMMDKENPMKATWNLVQSLPDLGGYADYSHLELMRLLLALLLFVSSSSCDLLEKIGNIKDFEGNPVNLTATLIVLEEESEKLGISLEKHYENCFEVKSGQSKGEELITPEEVAKHRKEISSFMFAVFTDFNFDSTEEVFEEMEEFVPRLFARRALVERTLGRLDKESQKLLRNIWNEFLELLVQFSQQTREQKLNYMATASKALKKWSNDYVDLSQEAKNSLEKITCAYTKLRIYDSKNTLANRFAEFEAMDSQNLLLHPEL